MRKAAISFAFSDSKDQPLSSAFTQLPIRLSVHPVCYNIVTRLRETQTPTKQKGSKHNELNGSLNFSRISPDFEIQTVECTGNSRKHFNGFAFRDLLEYNDYFNSLRVCPEFIYQLACVTNKDDMIMDYHNHSDYYCLEYVVPIDKVIIDGQDRFMTAYRKNMILIRARLPIPPHRQNINVYSISDQYNI